MTTDAKQLPGSLRSEKARLVHGALVGRIRAEGIYLRFNVIRANPTELGHYIPAAIAPSNEPTIQVYRNRRHDEVDDYERELATLAHEYGHALSDRLGERPRVAMPEPRESLPPEEKLWVEQEEDRAWTHGRKILIELGMTDLVVFDRCRADAREAYRARLWGP